MIKNILILSLIIVFSCKNTTKNNFKKANENSRLVDTTTTVIMNYDSNSSYHNYIFENSKATQLNDSDILLIEDLLDKSIIENNKIEIEYYLKAKKKRPKAKIYKEKFIIELNRYKIQYLPIVNSKGEKEVWVNCFCSTGNRNWKETIISAKDGGNCFFKLKINLTKGYYYEFSVNGEA